MKLFFIYMFYQVKYIKRSEGTHGYYLVPRLCFWIAFFPLAVLPLAFYATIKISIDYCNYMLNYDFHWIEGEERKLKFKEKLQISKQLF